MEASFVTMRFFSSTAALRGHFRLQHTLAVPAPTHLEAVLSTPELKILHTKAAGSWKQLSKEEVVQLYRATFPFSVKEIKNKEKAVQLYRATFPLFVKEIKNKEKAVQLDTNKGFDIGIGVGVGWGLSIWILLFAACVVEMIERCIKSIADTFKEYFARASQLLKQKVNPIEGKSSRS